MAKIIMIGNQKGGIGKTAVTVMTATALSQEPFNLKTCIIDLDRQKSITKTRSFDLQAYETENVSFDVLPYNINDLKANIGQLDKAYQLIFIDVAGHLDNSQPIEIQEITKALMYVDVLFVPFVSGGYNLDSTLEYYEFIKQVQTLRAVQPRELKVFGFVNMHRQRTRANQVLNEEIDGLTAKENLVMMQTYLNDYALFRESDTITSLYDQTTTDSAKANFATFTNEFLNIIQK
jgi:chromosome partitioning protein